RRKGPPGGMQSVCRELAWQPRRCAVPDVAHALQPQAVKEVRMSKFVVVIFPDAARAEEASRVLKELHSETSLTLHGAAVVRKDRDSDVAVSDRVEAGLPNAAIGALVGGLIGLLGGPVGLALG